MRKQALGQSDKVPKVLRRRGRSLLSREVGKESKEREAEDRSLPASVTCPCQIRTSAPERTDLNGGAMMGYACATVRANKGSDARTGAEASQDRPQIANSSDELASGTVLRQPMFLSAHAVMVGSDCVL